jgi:hypothetical protein
MKIGLILALCFSFFTISPPSDDVWEILSELKFDLRFDKELDDIIFTPKATKAIKKLVGKKITIKGFRSKLYFEEDTELRKNKIYLCRYNTESLGCCTPYGAEAYIEVLLDENLTIEKDKAYLFKGVFELNTKDYMVLPFTLKNAECLNCD